MTYVWRDGTTHDEPPPDVAQARERVIEAAREFATVKRTDLLPRVIARLHDAVAELDALA